MPTDADYIRFGDGFAPRVLVFVDTEEDFDWSAPMSRGNTKVGSIAQLYRAHELFTSFGIHPCYLVDYPIATNPESVQVLGEFLRRGECVIGSQLHPWVNPPFAEEINLHNSYPGNLPRAVEHAKLQTLSRAISDNFGVQPGIYRAGRYGIGPNTADILTELGYTIDVSVRPYFDYSRDGGPNFHGIDAQPYWMGRNRDLLEIPLTGTFTGLLSSMGNNLFTWASGLAHLPGVLARSGLLNRVALTPEGMAVGEVLPALAAMARRNQKLYCISFHSPSVEPGHTPYVRNAQDLKLFYEWLETVLGYLVNDIGATPARPEEIYQAAASTNQAIAA